MKGGVIEVDVAILGGGMLGVSAAYHLSRLGLKVVLFERERAPACHASGKNAGMIRQLFAHGQLTEWAQRSIRGWPRERKSLDFRETGSLIVDSKPPSHHEELFELREASSHQLPAVYTRTDGLLDPSGLVQGLLALSDKRRLQTCFGETVSSVFREKGEWHVETESGPAARAPWIVNALGAWLDLAIAPQHSELLLPSETSVRHLFVVRGFPVDYMPEDEVGFYWDVVRQWYIRVWSAEERLVSICDNQRAAPDSFIPNSGLHYQLSQKLLTELPGVAAGLSLGRSWHCFRVFTEDKLPIWGEDELAPGLFWLAAFGGYGMSTGFAAAEDAARYIAGMAGQSCSDFSPRRLRRARGLSGSSLRATAG